MGGGATATEVRGGCTLAHSTDLHQVLCQIEMPQLCGIHKSTIWAHFGVMMRDERMKHKSYNCGFTWSCDHGTDSNKFMGNQQLVNWKIIYYICKHLTVP